MVILISAMISSRKNSFSPREKLFAFAIGQKIPTHWWRKEEASMFEDKSTDYHPDDEIQEYRKLRWALMLETKILNKSNLTSKIY